LPDAFAVRVVIADAPPTFRVAFIAWVKPPVPERAVPAVSELLFVNVIPVTVMLGIEIVPVSA
jgi:hypothetical protein